MTFFPDDFPKYMRDMAAKSRELVRQFRGDDMSRFGDEWKEATTDLVSELDRLKAEVAVMEKALIAIRTVEIVNVSRVKFALDALAAVRKLRNGK